MMKRSGRIALLALIGGISLAGLSAGGQTVYVSRMWHNHQPLYWPEWNSNGSETGRVQYAWDSIILKPGQTYGTGVGHPDNNLTDIFGLDDRRNAYQGRPRDALAAIDSSAGFCMSYSGALIDNVRNLGANSQLGYGGGWWDGNRQARNWLTPSGSRRMDLVGFTYHHSLGPLLPKEVFRKELQIFKQAYWKAWNGNSNLSDHSRGFFPTEMAFSQSMIDVLAEEGYEWTMVASHHLSRTCPTYFDQFNLPTSYGIYSSPPNRADRLGPSPTSGWWYGEPNPGNAAWNVAPFAYQLHKARYVNPETGSVHEILLVPSDDVLSYRFGYANEGIGKIQAYIAPYATDPTRPVMVLPATDGDNAWGGGYSSWMEATPQFFNDSAGAGYARSAVQDFVDAHGAAADTVHVEDGAWIFPESDYGSPYFLKWIEPPLKAGSATAVPGTMVDLETPGFALKFWSWAPVITGANWCETAEQMLNDEGGSVQAWKIQGPYDWDGTWTAPNVVEQAWHIYLGGLDSGFNYYGGLGNDDEVKQSLATTRAIEKLSSYVNGLLAADPANDQTPPSVLRPQRFPWNPGGYTFGWFNSIPGDTSYLKPMPSEFYIWTHAYDISDVASINVKVRVDSDGMNTMANDQNETYAGGSDVGSWITLPMTKRVLPNTRAELNAAANNGQIDYFITPPELADYYFVKITNGNVDGFRGKLLDYYIEATDGQGNISKSDIQHVFVENDGAAPPVQPTGVGATAISSTQITVSWNAVSGATSYAVMRNGSEIGTTTSTNYTEGGLVPQTSYSCTVIARNATGDSPESDSVSAVTWAPPTTPDTPADLSATAVSSGQINLTWTPVSGEASYIVKRGGTPIGTSEVSSFSDTGLVPLTSYSYTVAASNSAGVSADSPPASAVTMAVPQDFVMDGSADYAGYWVLSSNMTLYAAVRGSRLYVSTSSSAGLASDHFILISDTLLPSATDAAPWAKAGTMAVPATKPFLAGESSNGWAGWFNAPAGSELFNLSGGQLEGSIDLIEAFGTVPPMIYLAVLAYETADGGALTLQAPTGNGDGNGDPGEFVAFPAESIRDSWADGTFDQLDPAREFVISGAWNVSNHPVLAWPCVPGRIYQAEFCDALTNGWQSLGVPVQAASGQDSLSSPDLTPAAENQRFYHVLLLNP